MYKRQGVELRLELGVPVEGAWTANYLAERGEAFEVRERGIRSVSYTHLDVYKRQID